MDILHLEDGIFTCLILFQRLCSVACIFLIGGESTSDYRAPCPSISLLTDLPPIVGAQLSEIIHCEELRKDLLCKDSVNVSYFIINKNV